VTCQVIISDYIVERRITLLLDASDFNLQAEHWGEADPVLMAFRNHPFFEGCTTWSDLNTTHFHALIINVLKICANNATTETSTSRSNPMILRLSFLLCSLISLIQSRSGCIIDLLRVNRVGRDDVFYDYNARLDITITPPKPGLRVVIDNA
jgi:hypothetical protein